MQHAPYAVPVLVHLNGEILPADRARVGVFDRGFLMGDGIYEGLRAFDGRVVRMDLHVRRMNHGLKSCRIAWDAPRMDGLTRDLLKANDLRDAFIYWQVTRGVPAPGQPVRSRVLGGEMSPTVFGYCVPAPPLAEYDHDRVPTKSAITTPDTRWHRGTVKSISLLGSVLGAIEGAEAGADDAIFVRDGVVAEGTAANLIAVIDRAGTPEVVTPSLESAPILAGVTRDILLERPLGIIQRSLGVDELDCASEVMLLGTLTMVTSIVRLNGRVVGNGAAGSVAKRLLRELCLAIKETP